MTSRPAVMHDDAMTNPGITLRLPPALYKKLSELAEAEGRSLNQQAIKLLQAHLDQVELLQRGRKTFLHWSRSGLDLETWAQSIAELEARVVRLEEKRAGKLRRSDDKVAVTSTEKKSAVGGK